jgi:hypothetical protein
MKQDNNTHIVQPDLLSSGNNQEDSSTTSKQRQISSQDGREHQYLRLKDSKQGSKERRSEKKQNGVG